jgi:hypothetical protein
VLLFGCKQRDLSKFHLLPDNSEKNQKILEKSTELYLATCHSLYELIMVVVLHIKSQKI